MTNAKKPLQTVNMITFGGGYSLPAWVAQGQGFFAKHGIEVNITHTPNSVFLMKNLIEGKFDLTVTAMDNLVAYQEGQGEAEYEGSCDLVAFMGVDDSFQSLMASPDIKSVADLCGKKIAVDALTTGYAFILREMIARAGMTDADVNWVKVGGGAQRLEALIKGEQDATLLNTPLDLAAEARGFTRLMRAKDELGGALCPCRHYEDKEAEVQQAFWNCPCVPMRERKECHCMLFLTEDNPFRGESQAISLEEIKSLISS